MDNLSREQASTVWLGTQALDCRAVARVACEGAGLAVTEECRQQVRASRAVVEAALEGETLIYGLNTGLGHRRNIRVARELLRTYQPHILRTHAGAVGRPLPDAVVRAMILARVVGIARGGAGVTEQTFDALVALLNRKVHPVVPEFGSVGASDLQVMAAIAQVLVGEGRARFDDEVVSGAEALARAGLRPIALEPKEGLALVSCNGLAIGGGALTVGRIERALELADLAGALSLEAIDGNIGPLDPVVQAAKPFEEQAQAAAHMRALLAGSFLHAPSMNRAVQDPLSFRTLAQVHGAVRRQTGFLREAVEIELNARNDNPLVDVDSGRLVSNGNFQTLSISLGFDAQRIGLAHVAMLSERRCNHLVIRLMALRGIEDHSRREVSGLIAYTAAEITARIKTIAAPASLHLSSLAQNVEDHGSLGPSTVAFTDQCLDMLEDVLAIEVMLASILIGPETAMPLGQGTGRAHALALAAIAECGEPDAGQAVATLKASLLREDRQDP